MLEPILSLKKNKPSLYSPNQCQQIIAQWPESFPQNSPVSRKIYCDYTSSLLIASLYIFAYILDFISLGVSEDEAKKILDQHNELRASILEARNMQKMVSFEV